MAESGFQDIKSEVITSLNDISQDAKEWGEAVKDALEQTPGDGVPQPADPGYTRPTPPDGSDFAKPGIEVERPDLAFSEPRTPVGVTPKNIERFGRQSQPDEDVDFGDIYSTYEPGAKPNLPSYQSPTVDVPSLAPLPEIDAPTKPALLGATAPSYQAPTWSDLSLSINPANLPGLSNNFDFTPDPFDAQLLTDVVSKSRQVIGGTGLLPSWVWDAIWSRAAGNLKRQELAAVREAQRAHAVAGWMMPGIVGLSREREARTKAADGLAELSRENAVQQAQMLREDTWKASDLLIQCEGILLQAHVQAQENALKAAVESNNAGREVYLAAVQAYQVTEIAVKDLLVKLKDLELRGDLAELQAFELELKAAGFALEIDKNAIEVYKAEWSGEETKAKAYGAYAEAVKAYAQSQAAAVEAFGKQVESNNTILQGWAIEWDAFVKRLEPARLRIQAHQAKNALFGNRIQKFSAESQAESARIDSDIRVEGLSLQAAQQDLELFKALWAGIQTKLDALTKAYATDAQVYGTLSQSEAARVGSLNQRYAADIQLADVDLKKSIMGMQARLGYWDRWMQTWTQWNSASAGAYAQLGAAAYAAQNYTLGASGSTGYNSSYQKSWARGYDVNVSVPVDSASGVDITPGLPVSA